MTTHGRPVYGLRFYTYTGALQVTVDFEGSAEALPDPPGWVLDITREHDGHGERWCRMGESAARFRETQSVGYVDRGGLEQR